jgi:hypothetical protein
VFKEIEIAMPRLSRLDSPGVQHHVIIRGIQLRKILLEKGKTPWQDVEYVLKWFGKTADEARKKSRAYVEKGISMDRRPDLPGGGLIIN